MKPWLDTEWSWTAAFHPPRAEYGGTLCFGESGTSDESLRLASAAPDMCRALLAVEWRLEGLCPYCDSDRSTGDGVHYLPPMGTSCWLDDALTKAGLPDQASRDAAREAMTSPESPTAARPRPT